MSLFTPERRPAVLGAALCAAGLAASWLGGASTHATHAAAGCRTDPIVTLSNGVVVHLSATINDTPSDVTGVAYTLHAPIGTSVVSVVYPPDPNNIPQTFQFYADNPAFTWDSYTNANTLTSGISVIATAEVNNLAVFTSSGLDHQQIQIHVGPDDTGTTSVSSGRDNGGVSVLPGGDGGAGQDDNGGKGHKKR